jgi:hypothetical protein
VFEWLDEAISNAKAAINLIGATFKVEMGEPASAAQLRLLESTLGLELPTSLRSFLSLHNGARFTVEARFSFFTEVLSTEGIVLATGEQKALWDGNGSGPWGGLIAIGRWLSGEEFIAFDPKQKSTANEFALLDVFHEDPNWFRDKPIANDLEELLRGALDAVIVHRQYPFYWDGGTSDGSPIMY